MTFFFAMVISILLGVTINSLTTPTIEEYVHGKVKLEVKQTVEDGVVVKCDTLYYYK